jgi:SAM-dependent methyltransferase
VRDVLRCPGCHGALRDTPGGALRCDRCDADHPADGERFDFLSDAMREQFGIIDTDNVSANEYDAYSHELIHRLWDGLILDCGAGKRSTYFENVVNLEIVAYPSTDVLSVGEVLPFADDSFDAVFSFAVLEHVKDPRACAVEIARVLKPGGLLYGQVPFLQPVHGYPNHYYNMTTTGLANLFEGLDVHHVGSFPFGQPIFALSWMVNGYAAGLPAADRDAFERLTVKDLMAAPEGMLGSPFVRGLSPEAREVLSCCNYLLATKPAPSFGSQPE